MKEIFQLFDFKFVAIQMLQIFFLPLLFLLRFYNY
jgi:hypothetical protein